MTQLSPQLEGQIKAPNPFEVFWDNHRKKVNAILIIVILAMLGSYGYRYWHQLQINSTWSSIAQAAKLDVAYTSYGSGKTFLDQDWGRQWYYGMTQEELVSRLTEQLKTASKKELDDQIAKHKGSSIEPFLLWVAANRSCALEEWDHCKSLLGDLQTRFPHHLLCMTTDYPVQWRFDRSTEKEKPKGEDAARAPKPDPDLVPPVKGSSVSLLLDQVERVVAFRKANDRFYKVEEPDGATVTIKTTLGEFKVRLYQKLAPKHCASFLERVKDGWFTGDHIDTLHRPQGKSNLSNDDIQEFRFGLESSKSEDRGKWLASEPSKVKLEWEQNDLSTFPGMLAADEEPDGKMSSGDRVWINGTDAYQHDGKRVIFGRVTEGLDVVKSICLEQFSTQQESTTGQGKPAKNIKIESVSVQ